MNSNQPEPAPTAEEQLPPLDITQADKAPPVGLYLGMEKEFLERLNCRTRQLLAALRSNREKDAKIAELTEQRDEWETHAGNHVDRIRKLEAKLRAVSEAAIKYCSEGRVDCLLARIREAIRC